MAHATFAHTTSDRINAARGQRPASLKERLALMVEISRERAALAKADAKTLEDLGITRAEAEAEASRPFWDVPAGR